MALVAIIAAIQRTREATKNRQMADYWFEQWKVGRDIRTARIDPKAIRLPYAYEKKFSNTAVIVKARYANAMSNALVKAYSFNPQDTDSRDYAERCADELLEKLNETI